MQKGEGKMLARYRFLGTAAALAIFLTMTAPSVWSEEPARRSVAPPDASILYMARFYTGQLRNVGSFPGRLICLRRDRRPAPGAASRCEREGHRHALEIDGDPNIHPLLAGSNLVPSEYEWEELYGKEVMVQGVFYPATGAILVSGVSAR